MNFNIALTCDQNWSVKSDSKSDFLPQTHFVQARTNQSYYAEYNSYKITGKKIVELNIKDINLNSLMKTRIKNVKDLILLMEFSECSGYNSIGTITAQIIEKEQSLALQFLGKLNTEDPFLEGHLYKFGDISRCKLSIGSMLNSLNMENTVGK